MTCLGPKDCENKLCGFCHEPFKPAGFVIYEGKGKGKMLGMNVVKWRVRYSVGKDYVPCRELDTVALTHEFALKRARARIEEEYGDDYRIIDCREIG